MILVAILAIFLLEPCRSQWRPTFDTDTNGNGRNNGLNGLLLSCPNCLEDQSSKSFSQCQSQCANSATCLAFAHHNRPNSCLLYNTTFGLRGATLVTSVGRHNYYEKQLTDLNETLHMRLQTITPAVAMADAFKTYLFRYREGIPGRVAGRSQIQQTATAELCAALCTRWRGQIDPVTGARCNSFNYQPTTQQCELLILFEAVGQYARVSRGSDFDLAATEWRYYERITVPGCWISQSECRMYDKNHPASAGTKNGTFQEQGVQYEWECASRARFYHELVCDNSVHVPTVTWWGGNNPSVGIYGIFEAWNSWDVAEGCVITIDNGGDNCTDRLDRFTGTFRDSLGEEDRGAALVAQHCFQRAELWYNECTKVSTRRTGAFHAASGRSYSFPINECGCDEYGLKIDPTTGRRYCTIPATSRPCSRSILDATSYDYPDILCDDIGNPALGCRPLVNNDSCVVIPPIACPTGAIPDVLESYHDLGVFATMSDCLVAATNLYGQCGSVDNLIVLWARNSTVRAVPGFRNPATETTVRAMTVTSAFTPTRLDDFGNPRITYLNLTTGRSMRFVSGKTGRVRHVDVWFRTETDATVLNLTLELFDGPDINGVLLASGWGIAGPNLTAGGFVPFALDSGRNVDNAITIGATYTWQLTLEKVIVACGCPDGSQSGYVGFTSGNQYLFGKSDFSDSIDYPFVVWYEFYQYIARPGAFTVAQPVDNTFKGIWFIVLLCIYVIFAAVLYWLHRRRLAEEEKERAQNKEIRERSEMSLAESSQMSRQSTEPRDGDGDLKEHVPTAGGRGLRMQQVPSVAPSEENSEVEEFIPSGNTKGAPPDKQRAYV